jgi:Legume lectin domain
MEVRGVRPRRVVRRFGLAAALVTLGLGASAFAGATPVADYPDFSSVDGLQLNGNAAQAGSVLRVTPASTSQTGTAFTTSKIVKHTKSWKTEFTISMHDSGGTPGDGMAFFVHPKGKGVIGDAGGGLGYASIGDSLAVEFDTFDNGGPDEDANEVAIIVNGKAGVSRDAAIPSFQLYGAERHAWISYKAKSDKVKAFVSDTTTKPSSPLVSAKVNLKNVLEGKARAGFTAATGGATEAHDVLDWTLTQ